MRALLTPGEGVLNHRGMGTLDKLNAGVVPTSSEPKVIINLHGLSDAEKPKINYKRQLEGVVVDIFLKHRRDLLGYGY